MENIDFKFLTNSRYWDAFWDSVHENYGYDEQDIRDFKNGKNSDLYRSFIKFHNERWERTKKIMENLDS